MPRALGATERFENEIKERKLRAAYVLIGDEAFFRRRCREAILAHLVPPEMRDLAVYEFDLAETDIHEILDRARTPSLMAPFQVFFVRGVKAFYGRGSHKEEFETIEQYVKDPNPGALLVFIADHISIPADVRRMELQDRDKYERLRETLGDFCGIVELARVEEGEAVRWVLDTAAAQGVKVEQDAARELVDALGGDMMMIANELEKLSLFVGEKKRVTLGDVETMVLAAKQRSLYELTDAISTHNQEAALSVLDAILSSGDGDDAAIGHLYMLAKTFRQMLVICERKVRDSRMLYQALWQGFRVPPFAADDIIRQARRYESGGVTARVQLRKALRLIARADLAVRSNPPSRRLVLEQLVLQLAAEPRVQEPMWQQEEMSV